MREIVLFLVVVGCGATALLDLWGLFLARVLGIGGANWGLAGRWLFGLMRGRPVLDTTDTGVPSLAEKVAGWSFHYLVGVAYAALLLIGWGTGYALHPTGLPVILIGFVLTTCAGLFLFVPAMGGGLCFRNAPAPMRGVRLMLLGHAVFAVGQYGCALILAAS